MKTYIVQYLSMEIEAENEDEAIIRAMDASGGHWEAKPVADQHDGLIPPDPRFPDRPHTLDFARLSSALSEQDAVAEALGLEEALGVEPDSLLYMAEARIQKALLYGVSIDAPSSAILQSIFFDGFQLGVGFQKRGGHRPTETGTAGKGGSQ